MTLPFLSGLVHRRLKRAVFLEAILIAALVNFEVYLSARNIKDGRANEERERERESETEGDN